MHRSGRRFVGRVGVRAPPTLGRDRRDRLGIVQVNPPTTCRTLVGFCIAASNRALTSGVPLTIGAAADKTGPPANDLLVDCAGNPVPQGPQLVGIESRDRYRFRRPGFVLA